MSEELSSQKATTGENDRRYIAFSLGSEQYAIPLLQAKEFIGITEPTPVPQTPDYFKGIINLRGQVISVIDLKEKLRLPKSDAPAKDSREASIIILNLGNLFLGVIVDSINSVLALNEDELGPPPTLDKSSAGDYIIGVARKDGRLTLILDIEALLNVQDIEALRKNSKANAA